MKNCFKFHNCLQLPNNLSDVNFVAPHKFNGDEALSVLKEITFTLFDMALSMRF